ncbi:hypothetical protein E3E12_01115 [Formicincola oecophyllae]|uniref:Uncharacterized protein n=1 Tax=Formicincola oecophyllae TaxID=2558361 RepID=A0A4Y6U6N7_9PROT|nr:hypothetical protein [Formicincola oecophyllae]QDH13022.1 hypothetical protein E3E12_01115 [Formicincola oecophyllae]
MNALLVAAMVSAGLGLSGCLDPSGETTMEHAPACPVVDVPTLAGDRIRYDGRGLDIGHVETQQHIISVTGDCANAKPDRFRRPMTRVRIGLTTQIEGGAAVPEPGQDDRVALRIPWFVAVVKNGTILGKKIFYERAPIPAEGQTEVFKTPLHFIDVPTGGNPHVSTYVIETGFQLTGPELDYNRQHLDPAHYERTTEPSPGQ